MDSSARSVTVAASASALLSSEHRVNGQKHGPSSENTCTGARVLAESHVTTDAKSGKLGQCGNCETLSGQMLTFYHLYLGREEELRILRLSQVECMSMAEDIQNLHVCVEEQRRHLVKLAQHRQMKVDPGVGLNVLLHELSRKQRAQLQDVNSSWATKLNEQKTVLEKELTDAREMYTLLHVEYMQVCNNFQLVTASSCLVATELAQTKQHLDTYIAKYTDNESVVQFLQHSNAFLQQETSRYLQCVDEQQRHMRLMNECAKETREFTPPLLTSPRNSKQLTAASALPLELFDSLEPEQLTSNNLPVELFVAIEALERRKHKYTKKRASMQNLSSGTPNPESASDQSTENASNVLVKSSHTRDLDTNTDNCTEVTFDADVGIHALISKTKHAEFGFYTQKLEQLTSRLQNEYIEQLAKMQHVIKAQMCHSLRISEQDPKLGGDTGTAKTRLGETLDAPLPTATATAWFSQTPYKVMRSFQKQIQQQQRVITNLQQDNEMLVLKLEMLEQNSEMDEVLNRLDKTLAPPEAGVKSKVACKSVANFKCTDCAKTMAHLKSYEQLLFHPRDTQEPDSGRDGEVDGDRDAVSTLLATVFERMKQRQTKVVWVYSSVVGALHKNTTALIRDKEQNTQKRLKVLNGLVTTLSEKTEMLKGKETFISTLQRVNRDVLHSRDALQTKLVAVVLAKQTADALAQTTSKKLESMAAQHAQLAAFTAKLKTMIGKLAIV